MRKRDLNPWLLVTYMYKRAVEWNYGNTYVLGNYYLYFSEL